MRGRRKAVVWFSEGINYDISNPIKNRYATDVLEEEKGVVAAATRSNVSIYGVDPRGLTSGQDDAIEIGSFADDNSIGPDQPPGRAADLAGQPALPVRRDRRVRRHQQNDFRDAFSRILQDNSSYYVLGYYPTNDKRDGRFRSIQVRVNQPGLKVRARKGYVAPRGKPEATKAASNATTSPGVARRAAEPCPRQRPDARGVRGAVSSGTAPTTRSRWRSRSTAPSCSSSRTPRGCSRAIWRSRCSRPTA